MKTFWLLPSHLFICGGHSFSCWAGVGGVLLISVKLVLAVGGEEERGDKSSGWVDHGGGGQEGVGNGWGDHEGY